MKTNIIVHLRIYKGKINYDIKGKVTSDVQMMKLKYGVLEWVNFTKRALLLGYRKIEIVKCTDGNNKLYKTIDTPQEIIDSVEKAMKGQEVKLTPKEQEIKDLKETVAKLVDAKEKPVKEETKEGNVDELEAARAEYTKLFDKKPSHLMKLEGLKKKISDKLAE